MIHEYGYPGWGGFGVLGWAGLIFRILVGLGLLIVLAALVVWAIRSLASGGRHGRPVSPAASPIASTPGTSPNSPREILQQRYARGEITRDQYLQMMSDLGLESPQPTA